MVTGGIYMKKYLFAFFWACLVIAGYAQEQKGTVYGVAFYNLENLFDTTVSYTHLTLPTT